MKIVRFEAENFKRLRAVEIVPDADGSVVIVAGRNGAGKTSVLDAIWQTLGGGPAAKGTPKPVRDGEDSAHVTLDLGDLVVTRTWKPDGRTSLKVSAADGASYSSPQTVLDRLVGRMCFDPLAFSRLTAKDQLAEMLTLVELTFDVDELAARRRGIYDERTNVNRDLAAAKSRLAVLPAVDSDVPAEEFSAQEILDGLAVARAVVDENDRKRRVLVEYESDLEQARAAAARAQQNLEEAQQRVNDADRECMTMQSRLETGREIVAGLVDPEVTTFTEQLSTLEETNAAVRAAKSRQQLVDQVNQLADKAGELSGKLIDLDDGKADALAAADMPIDGLAFDEDGVTYQGVPFSQCSAAEQLRVSVAMAIALNPEVRVIRITDGSLLDSESMRLIEEMAADRDYQVWIEVVDETGDVGVVIEDGAVATRIGAVA